MVFHGEFDHGTVWVGSGGGLLCSRIIRVGLYGVAFKGWHQGQRTSRNPQGAHDAERGNIIW